MTDRWTAAGGKIILLLHTLTMRGSHVASLVKFHPGVYNRRSLITLSSYKRIIMVGGNSLITK